MRKATSFRGLKVDYILHEQDGLPFADVLEVSKDGAVLDLSTHDIERVKSAIYGRIRLEELFESMGNKLSAGYWRER